MKPMTRDEAMSLASRMVLEGAPAHGVPRLSARVVPTAVPGEYNFVFEGGKFGSHSLPLKFTDRERAVSHWEGYCTGLNGYTINAALSCVMAPPVGAPCTLRGRWTRYGTVAKVGPKRVTIEFTYKNGRQGRHTVPIDMVMKNPGVGYTART